MMFGASLFKTVLNLTTGLMNISRMKKLRGQVFDFECYSYASGSISWASGTMPGLPGAKLASTVGMMLWRELTISR